ncbi:MAG: topoisomerase DNA-binding C4 zinc finger domain-containing protein [bacterium]|nr:topoisomerase DNA-binding C4 zinc finger domain-containing protein [bacterium]
MKEKAEKDNAPQCPKCGAPMRLRVIKKGVRQGETFWGCTGYPKCDGTKKK